MCATAHLNGFLLDPSRVTPDAVFGDAELSGRSPSDFSFELTSPKYVHMVLVEKWFAIAARAQSIDRKICDLDLSGK